METVKSDIGSHISKYAEKCEKRSRELGENVMASFNGAEVIVNPIHSAKHIETMISNVMSGNAERYRNSPEGIERQEKNDNEVSTMQREAHDLLAKLETLDLSDHRVALQFLNDYQPYSDRVGVDSKMYLVRHIYSENGYETNCNLGDDFKEDDEENFARYIIGQGLTMVAIHHMLISFTEQWKEKFNIK